jgi:hypothetical protein
MEMPELPKRPSRHSSGERGIAILKLALPQSWILRNQVESDYGIDVEVEIADDHVSGIILKGQVRTKTPIAWRQDDTFREPFDSGKLLYWRTIQLPVVLFLVDNESEEVFWTPASGEVPADSCLPSEIIVARSNKVKGNSVSIASYATGFTPHRDARRLLYRIAFYLDVFRKHEDLVNRDSFLPLEPDEYASFDFLYDETLALRSALGASNKGVVPWLLWAIRSTSIFGDAGEMCYGIHDEALLYLKPLVDEVRALAKKILDQEQPSFLNFAAKNALEFPGIIYGAPVVQSFPAEFWEAIEEHLASRGAKRYDLAKHLKARQSDAGNRNKPGD